MSAYLGLFPAAGKASRLALKSTSKEVLPVSLAGEPPRPVGLCLLKAWALAGINEAVIIGRPGKEDLEHVLAAQAPAGMRLHFCHATHPWGTPFTLDSAHPLSADRPVALGFPDILLRPENSFGQLRTAFEQTGCDVMLGLFPASAPTQSDMVKLADNGDVLQLDIKPTTTELTQTWAIALWRPVFTAFLHHYIARITPDFARSTPPPEPFVGTVFKAAIREGLSVKGIPVRNGEMLDIGTPAALEKAQSGAFFRSN